MKRIPISAPELAIIAGTRAAFGAGAALLLGGLLKPEQRKAVGWTLLAVGAITTVPIVVQILRSQEDEDGGERSSRRHLPREEYAS